MTELKFPDAMLQEMLNNPDALDDFAARSRSDLCELIQQLLDFRQACDGASKMLGELNDVLLPKDDEINRLRAEVNTLEEKLKSEVMYREIFQKRDAELGDAFDDACKLRNEVVSLRTHLKDVEKMVFAERVLADQAGEKEGKLFVENVKLNADVADLRRQLEAVQGMMLIERKAREELAKKDVEACIELVQLRSQNEKLNEQVITAISSAVELAKLAK